jgi:ATP-dependent DNA helicase PIF1
MVPKRRPAALPRTASGLEINPEFGRALELLENTNRPVFITGRAGTGKSTLLDHFRSTTRKRVAVLAPTGVAALNVRGQTIHSFCRFKPDVTLASVKALPKSKAEGPEGALYRNLDTVIIDEVSMVRADLLDCVEKFLRLNGPLGKRRFGGLQMVFIGDLYQLPPVVTNQERALFDPASGSPYDSPFFFSARVLADGGYPLEFIELEKIYRQSEAGFIALLNAIRNRSVSEADLKLLNARLDPEFAPEESGLYITLTSTNEQALRRNREKLETLGGETFGYDAVVDGEFDRTSLPTDERLEIKVGAQVMLLTNDPAGRWVNGTIGQVIEVVRAAGRDDVVEVELRDGEIVDIGPNAWEIFRFVYDRDDDRIVSEAVGAFTQYPLKLAWAVTIHKSQGKTFDRVIVDVGRGTFAHGQVYVALSRCTTFEGLVLRKPIRREHIRMDWRVVKFLTGFQYARSEERLAYGEKRRLIEEAISEGRPLEIVYLKPDDTKSRRRIRPESLEPMEFGGRTFEGLKAWCYEREDIRHFRIERMLEIKVL